MKHKLFVFINVIGLGIALVCCIVAFLNWNYNTKFDTYHTNTNDVYLVNFIRITNDRPIKNGNCPLPLGDQIATSFPKVDQVIRYFLIGGNFRVNNEVFRANISGVDQAFFETFNFPMVFGSAEGINDKQSIVISEELSAKHFPDKENPVGEVLTYINEEVRLELQVAGVFKVPYPNIIDTTICDFTYCHHFRFRI